MQETPPRVLGLPTTWVGVPGPANAAAILRAIRQGHVALSAQPDGPLLELGIGSGLARAGDAVTLPHEGEIEVNVRCRRGAGGQLRLLDQNRLLLSARTTEDDESVQTRLTVAASLYVRAELRDAESNMLALTDPVYFDSWMPVGGRAKSASI